MVDRIQLRASIGRRNLACAVVMTLACLPALAMAPLVHAAAEAISQSYQTSSDNVGKGALLSLVASGSSRVELADSLTNGKHLVGVAADEPLLTLSSGDARSTQVVIGGTTDVMVSDLDGSIRAGDKVTASPISGIGTKAVRAAEVVGTAQADFAKVRTVSRQVKGQDGSVRDIKVGLLPVAVNVSFHSPVAPGDRLSAFVPSFVQSVADAVAGKPVAPLKVLLSFVILIIGFTVVLVIMYASVHSGVISIGRNPLAYKMLRRGMMDVIIAAIAILIVSGVIAYVLLII